MSFITKWLSRKSVEMFGKSDSYIDLYALYLHWGFQQHLTDDKPHLFVRFFRLFGQLLVWSYCIGLLIVAYQLRNDIEKSSRKLSFAIFTFLLIVNIYTGNAKQQDIEATLVSLSHNLYQEDTDDSDENSALQKSARRAFFHICVGTGLYCFFGIILRATGNAIDEDVTVPIFFLDQKNSIYVLVADTIGMIYLIFWYLLHEVIACGVFLRIRENFYILHRNIEKDGEAVAALADAIDLKKYSKMPAKHLRRKIVNERAFWFLRKNIAHHQKILKVVRTLDDFYWLSSIINIIGFGCVFVIAYFNITLLLGTSSWQSPLIEVMYALGSMISVMIKCLLGNEIKCASQAAADALYFSPWTEMNPMNRKILKLFQAALQQKSKITARQILGFNHKFLASFFRSMYGYVAFVQNMVRRK